MENKKEVAFKFYLDNKDKLTIQEIMVEYSQQINNIYYDKIEALIVKSQKNIMLLEEIQAEIKDEKVLIWNSGKQSQLSIDIGKLEILLKEIKTL